MKMMNKWIIDNSNSNIINRDHIIRIYYEDRGRDYTCRYRIMAETQYLEFVLHEFGHEETARKTFWGYVESLNS